MNEPLFPLPDEQEPQNGEAHQGKPRLKQANRMQIQLRPTDLESLLAEDHPARLIWDFIEQLDLSPLYERIPAVEGHAGQSAIDPKILMTLWPYATLEGVGSARALDRLCQEHDAYRWICGDVSVNYHTLADFRVDQGEFLDVQLTESVAALMAEGLVTLKRTAQDGMRVRANAGSSSFRGRSTLEKCLQEAEAHVQSLRKEMDEDSGAHSRRQRAARERARRERGSRVRKALKNMGKLEQKRKKSHKKASSLKAVKASTTDPEARIMRMPDGGFRPAYTILAQGNAQLAVDTESKLVVGVDVTNAVDQGQMAPMLAQLERRYGKPPQEHLVDDGFVALQDLSRLGPPKGHTVIYAPVPSSWKERKDETGGEGEEETSAILAWQRRMKTPEARAVYDEATLWNG
jgi:transposase